MGARASFLPSDLTIVGRAATVAEDLTTAYFNLRPDEWKRNPYDIFTGKHVDDHLYEPNAFASVVKVVSRERSRGVCTRYERFGIVLQEPNILRALLRTADYDLWTLLLFVLTHELIHIVRFRIFGVDFFGGAEGRDREEKLVQGVTKDILQGVPNTATLLSLYDDENVRDREIPYNTPREWRF